jgi:hypothetical protein
MAHSHSTLSIVHTHMHQVQNAPEADGKRSQCLNLFLYSLVCSVSSQKSLTLNKQLQRSYGKFVVIFECFLMHKRKICWNGERIDALLGINLKDMRSFQAL